ncbi:hypothetical protein LJC27_06700 [Christensenellaceae bacterium OttesenSCG-928-M15]|nr:hypothetical protein [Christensenellaceae bacterium OttesenSCG-928-M15]
MKLKRIVAFATVAVSLLLIAAPALALAAPRAVGTVRVSATKGTGNEYELKCITSSSSSANLEARVYLYKQGSTKSLGSATKTGKGYSVTASFKKTLAPGTYVVKGFGSSGGSDGKDEYTFTVR